MTGEGIGQAGQVVGMHVRQEIQSSVWRFDPWRVGVGGIAW
jgi:hypothetical protein